MRRIFVDTSYLIAISFPQDTLHSAAVSTAAALEAEQVRFVSSQPVLVELLAYVSKRGAELRQAAGELVIRLESDALFTIVRQTPELFDEGFALYRARPDKGYSLTDCMSMVICRQQDIADVLTHDHHFEQEGLRALF